MSGEIKERGREGWKAKEQNRIVVRGRIGGNDCP